MFCFETLNLSLKVNLTLSCITDRVPIMRKAAGIVTDHGGRTCHAAIVSRELGIPAVGK